MLWLFVLNLYSYKVICFVISLLFGRYTLLHSGITPGKPGTLCFGGRRKARKFGREKMLICLVGLGTLCFCNSIMNTFIIISIIMKENLYGPHPVVFRVYSEFCTSGSAWRLGAIWHLRYWTWIISM